jgi:hypothetical protein
LIEQTILTEGLTAAFAISASDRDALLRGLDDLDLLLTYVDKIDEHERRRPGWLPTLTMTERHGE